jgi:hypothetical protein
MIRQGGAAAEGVVESMRPITLPADRAAPEVEAEPSGFSS